MNMWLICERLIFPPWPTLRIVPNLLDRRLAPGEVDVEVPGTQDGAHVHDDGAALYWQDLWLVLVQSVHRYPAKCFTCKRE